MRTLSFDTSTNALHVCLLEEREPVFAAQVTPEGAERQEVASLLMPQIDSAFKAAGWAKSSLDLIVVGAGPGSFTGIRVAVITARTLAQFLQLPLIGVSLLETYFAASPESKAGVILSTTSQQYFYGAFAREQDDPAAAVLPPGFGDAEAVAAILGQLPVCFADEKAVSALSACSPRPLPLIKNIACIQAQLAYDRLSLKRLVPQSQDGRAKLAETFPWRDVLPLYLRSPSVTVKKTYAT